MSTPLKKAANATPVDLDLVARLLAERSEPIDPTWTNKHKQTFLHLMVQKNAASLVRAPRLVLPA
jgi:hypothetical protein